MQAVVAVVVLSGNKVLVVKVVLVVMAAVALVQLTEIMEQQVLLILVAEAEQAVIDLWTNTLVALAVQA
jgi:hypothetical protein